MKTLILGVIFSTSAFAQSSVIGRWTTIDDETSKPKSVIEIFEKDSQVYGKIEKLFKGVDEEQNPKCDKCPGDLKDKQIIGMQIMNNFIKASDVKWVDGEILDPNNGKTYSCKIELIEDGKKLRVRGFIGISWLGRTQIWERASSQ